MSLIDTASANPPPLSAGVSAFEPAETGLQAVIDAVRDIFARTGRLPPERSIAAELGVKRHQLRRALEALRAEGELEPARTGRRALTGALQKNSLVNSTNPIEVMELRLVLEPALARLAALRASPVEIERIRRAAIATPGLNPASADLAFHRAVSAGARNSLAAELYVLLHRVAIDSRVRFTENDRALYAERLRLRDAEHRAIAEAIAARDPDAAERAMWQHLSAVQQRVLGRLSPGN